MRPAKKNPFRVAFYIKNYELLPLMFVVSFVLTGMASICTHRFLNTDIVLTRKSKTQGELTELLLEPRNRKMVTISQTFEPNPDLEKLYQDMAKAECERESKK